MKEKMKNLIKNNEMLHYIAMCVKNRNDPVFRDTVRNFGKDYTKIKVARQNGTSNGVKPIYCIRIGSSTIGFFALMRLTLNALAYAEYYGFAPVVIFNKEVSYQEEHGVDGVTNAFEYYFLQPTVIEGRTEDFINGQKSVIECIPEHYTQTFRMFGLDMVQDYLLSKDHYQFLAEMMAKYLHLQPHIEKRLNDEMTKYVNGEKIIGVHYRGTDFKNNYGSHPVALGVEDYIQAIQNLPKKYSNYKIFLATDDVIAVQQFHQVFGNRICMYTDVQRADGNLSVICSESNRPNHHFLLGYEVLRDMYTLSKCDVLVAGLSQVSIFARITKLSRNELFEHEVLINKGINKNKRSHTTDINKARRKQ